MTKTPALDRVNTYARAVLDGVEVAGPHVRNACQRHFDDLAQAHERGYFGMTLKPIVRCGSSKSD